jgi:hypothetical protein
VSAFITVDGVFKLLDAALNERLDRAKALVAAESDNGH